jgi:hypothetical protein
MGGIWNLGSSVSVMAFRCYSCLGVIVSVWRWDGASHGYSVLFSLLFKR